MHFVFTGFYFGSTVLLTLNTLCYVFKLETFVHSWTTTCSCNGIFLILWL